MKTDNSVIDSLKNKKSYKVDERNIPAGSDLIIGCFDIPVTTKCTLRCRNCSSLMPYYHRPNNYNMEDIVNNVESLLNAVDYIIRINVLGGEPFLHPELYRLLRLLNDSPKVEKIRVISNGMIIPKMPELFDELKNSKTQIRISHYTIGTFSIEGLLTKLESEGVAYTLKEFGVNDFQWFDYGGFHKRNRTDEELKKQKMNCDVEWYSLLDGRLFCCPRAAHATDLGLIPDDEKNYCSVNCGTIELRKRRIREFILNNTYNSACDYCDRGTENCNVVMVAEQI